jgi:hypothetical protein
MLHSLPRWQQCTAHTYPEVSHQVRGAGVLQLEVVQVDGGHGEAGTSEQVARVTHLQRVKGLGRSRGVAKGWTPDLWGMQKRGQFEQVACVTHLSPLEGIWGRR